MIIRSPQASEMEAYFNLRWSILRAPWGKPKGEERDEMEGESFHIVAVDAGGEFKGCGRLQLNNGEEAQIRYMGVAESERGKGTGKLLMRALEEEAIRSGASRIILQARENAVPFYLSCGYSVVKPTFLLWDQIQHFLMQKELK